MTFLEAAFEILKREGRPLHYKELTERVLAKKLLTFVGRTPEVTMQTQLTAAVKKAPGSPFVRVKPGVFGLLRYPEVAAEPEPEAAPKAAAAEGEEARAEGRGRRRRRRGGRGRRKAEGGELTGEAEVTGTEAEEAPEGEEAEEPIAEAPAAAPVADEGLDAAPVANGEPASFESGGAASFEGGEVSEQPRPEPEEEAAGEEPVQGGGAEPPAYGETEGLEELAATDMDQGEADEEGDLEEPAAEEESAPGASEGGEELGPGGRRRRRRRRRRRGGEALGAGFEGAAAPGASEVPPLEAGEREGGEAALGPAPAPDEAARVATGGEAPEGAEAAQQQRRTILTPIDAAIEVLRGQAPGRGVHVRQIADTAVRRRLIHGEPNEAWRVMRAALAAEPRERLRAGVRPRIRAAGSGLFALSRRPPDAELEKAELVFGEARRALRERTVAALERRIAELPAAAFEAMARVLLQREGFGPATFVKRVDGTIYVEALRGRGSRPSKCLVAMRPGGSSAGRRSIGELRAGIRARGQDEGVLMLAGRLADEAITEWKQPGPPIEVADSVALAETCIRHGVGVLSANVSVDLVDADFFAELAEG